MLLQALARFTPEQRDCYREDEIDLMYLPKSHGYRYEMSNCLFEASLQQIELQCNCTPKYFVGTVEGFEACEGKKKKCMHDLLGEMGDFRSIMDEETEKV